MKPERSILAKAQDWPPEVRARMANELKAIMEGERRAWYCDRIRWCDGEPHEGYDYPHARADQWPPVGGDWFTWFLSGGRGSGKTRTGAEYARRMSSKVSRMALIAPTGADVRDTIIEGESGLEMVCALAGTPVKWEPSKRRVTFENGCIATTFSGEEPRRLRGPQFGFAWIDEPSHIPLIQDVWDNMLFGLRLGGRPHVTLTSTPLPTKWTKERQAEESTRVVRVSTYANLRNLAPTFKDTIVSRYEGTRLGQQELHGMVLLDVEGALWNTDMMKYAELTAEEADRIVIFIDPAGSTNNKSDETGVIVAGKFGDRYHVFEDLTDKYSPDGWARAAIKAYLRYNADAIGAEKNYGGDMVKSNIVSTLKDMGEEARVIVTTASRSKELRAEPIVGLYEQGRVTHAPGLDKLEEEQCAWVPGVGKSPNRIDAEVHAITELMGKNLLPGSFAAAKGKITQRGPATGQRSLFQRSIGR